MRGYVTSRGRVGISFGFFGAIIMGVGFILWLVVLAMFAVVVIIGRLLGAGVGSVQRSHAQGLTAVRHRPRAG